MWAMFARAWLRCATRQGIPSLHVFWSDNSVSRSCTLSDGTNQTRLWRNVRGLPAYWHLVVGFLNNVLSLTTSGVINVQLCGPKFEQPAMLSPHNHGLLL